tara:strand:- start:9699 stop:9914 length:216 start_codon:yes stop_codon:yes gene_type:complete
MDIKLIAGLVGLVITLGSLFVFQGQLIQRIEVLESKSFPDVKQMQLNNAEIQVLKAKIESINARNSNPLEF